MVESGNFSLSAPKPGFAAVYVGRPYGWNVSYIPLSVELNGRPLAQLGISTSSDAACESEKTTGEFGSRPDGLR
jgi:hypothetical protein